MSQILKPDQVVLVGERVPCRVEKFLGGGGQGEVYQALLMGQPLALKWYFPASATPEQYDTLSALIERQPPTDRFLWPSDLVVSKDVPGFGYVMPLRESHYRGIIDLMKGAVSPSFRALTRLGYELSYSFLRLHAEGLCYRDISFGNVFFDPDSGAALICDNDNVTVDGASFHGITGTQRFMAPEIVRNEAVPSAQTDRYSLAVLLFYIFHIGHPLEGAREASIRCFDMPAMVKLYGKEPVFVFDPANESNRPVPGYNDNPTRYWGIYPQFLRDLFTQSFTVGLTDPKHGRVQDSVWQRAMIRLSNAIFRCRQCTAENFHDSSMSASPGTGQCGNCATQLLPPPRLKIGRETVMLDPDTVLHLHSIDTSVAWNHDPPVAAVVPHPSRPGVFGLENRSRAKWTCTFPDGRVADVEPGKRASLIGGSKINFGAQTGEVVI